MSGGLNTYWPVATARAERAAADAEQATADLAAAIVDITAAGAAAQAVLDEFGQLCPAIGDLETATVDSSNRLIAGASSVLGDVVVVEGRIEQVSALIEQVSALQSHYVLNYRGLTVPAVENFSELTVDSNNRAVEGSNTDFEPLALIDGELRNPYEYSQMVADALNAASRSFIPAVQDFTDVTLDRNNCIMEALTTKGRKMALDAFGALSFLDGGQPAETVWTEGEGADYETDPTFWQAPADILPLWLAYGQSYSLAAAAGDFVSEGVLRDPYSTSARDAGYALMPDCGIWPNGEEFTSFVDLYAQNVMNGIQRQSAETIMPEAAHRILSDMQAAFGAKTPQVFALHGQGGTNYPGLKRGTDTYTELLRIVRRAFTVAADSGKRLYVPAVFICHGEADKTQPDWTYARALRQWRSDLQHDIEAITGASPLGPLKFITYAPCRGDNDSTVALAGSTAAMQEVARQEPHLFTIAGPAYSVEHAIVDDVPNEHPTILGYRQLGDMMGRAAFWQVFGSGWRGLDVVRCYWTSTTTIRAELHAPYGGTLNRDETDAIIGYPADDEAYNYIGPPPGGSESDGRDSGIYVRDHTGAFGVVSAVKSGLNIDITLSRAGGVGNTVLMFGPRTQNPDSQCGTRDDCARTIWRGSEARTIPDSGENLYDWLIPSEHRL